MHELSIAMSMIDVAQEEAARRGGEPVIPVTAIYVKIGTLSGVTPDALAAAYELARESTALSNTRLVIEEVPGAELLVTALEFES
jgi:hydrogenase nickel incorporation protein HypA/HybF